jgi:hypothetical protein
MGKEVKAFNSCDAQWKKLMKGANDNPNVKRYAEDQKNLFFHKILSTNNVEFEKI